MIVPEAEIQRCRRAGAELSRRWEVRERDARWAPFVAADGRRRSTVFLEDVSAIPFVSGVPGVQEYQHRARVRAGDGDVYVCVSPPAPGYEEYCRDLLGLGAPEFVLADRGAVDDPCAVATAASRGAAFDQLAAHARRVGAVSLHPYMAIEQVWTLAEQLHATTGADVDVIGPTPAALWIANDKARFSELVAATAGSDHLVETIDCETVNEIAEALGELAGRHGRVGIKRTRCASAMGNKVLDAAEVRDMTPSQRAGVVALFLEETEWRGDEDVLAVEWADTEVSPSTQLWLPIDGPPVCEGVYEQLLEGEERCFLGSRPSTLPEPVNRALVRAALKVGAGLQAIGYSGRCSFDFVITGDLDGDFGVKFIECNGRWGGTSTPMHLVDRLRPGLRRRPDYVAQDWMEQDLEGAPFSELLRVLGPELFDPRTGTGRFVLYNVGPLHERGKFDVIGFGSDPRDAWKGVREVLPALLASV